MGIFDKRKLQKEKKRLENNLIVDEVPSFMVTSKLIKLVPDAFQRQELIERLIALNLTKQQYNKFVEIYQNDQEISLSLLDYYEINKQQIPFESTFYKQFNRDFWLENATKLATVMSDEKFSLSTFEIFIEQLKEKNNLSILSNFSSYKILGILMTIENKPELNEVIIKYIYDIDNILFVYNNNGLDTELKKKFIENLMTFSVEEGKEYINNIKKITNKMNQKKINSRTEFNQTLLLKMCVITNDSLIQHFVNDIYEQNFQLLSDVLSDENFCKVHDKEIKQFYFCYMNQNINENKLELAKNTANIYYLNHLLLTDGCKNILNDMLKNPENLSLQMKKVLNIYSKIKNCKNINELKKIIAERTNTNFSISYEELLNECVKFRNQEYSQNLLNPSELKESDKVSVRNVKYVANFDSKEHTVKIITLHNLPFEGLFHNINDKDNELQIKGSDSAKYSKDLINNPRLWKNSNHEGTEYISMTLAPVQLLRLFSNGKTGITLGYSKLKDNQIKRASGSDAGIDMSAGTSLKADLNSLPSKKEIMNCYYQSTDKILEDFWRLRQAGNYNELNSEREDILPDYCMVTDEITNTGCATLDNNTMEWAAYYDIPIIELDCKSYYESALLEFKQSLQKIKNQNFIPSIQEILKLSEQKKMVDCFSKETITDGYTLIMDIINLDNKVWSLENTLRLDNILNSIFGNNEIANSLIQEIANKFNYSEEQIKKIKEMRIKQVKELKEKVVFYLQKQEEQLIGKNK